MVSSSVGRSRLISFAESCGPVLHARLPPDLREPLLECLVDTLASDRFADLRVELLHRSLPRIRFYEFCPMLVVVRFHVFIRNENAGSKPLVDKSENSQLPAQILAELLSGQPIF